MRFFHRCDECLKATAVRLASAFKMISEVFSWSAITLKNSAA